MVFAASLEKAILFNEHGLTMDAKREIIDLIFEKDIKDKDKAPAYYLLGNIAFEEDRIKPALSSWERLVERYPNSNEAGLVRDRIAELSEIVVGSAKESLDNAVARSYLRHAEFWSDDKSDVFTIDSSWIPKLETAIKWYDKVIAEFPKSEASRIAYEGKLRTLLGWKESDRDGESYGIEASFYMPSIEDLTDFSDVGKRKIQLAETRSKLSYSLYMPWMLNTFEKFERDHPKASTLQVFRYQIAQVYWRKGFLNQDAKNLELSKEWLNKVIGNAGDNDSFYRDLAERRLKNLKPK